MDSSFAQRLRRNSSGGEPSTLPSSLQASFSENSSRLFNSVNTGRKNLFGGLSTKIDRVQSALKKAGTIDLGDTGRASREFTDAASASSGRDRRSSTNKKSDKPKPPKPPPPKLTRRTTINGAITGGHSIQGGDTNNVTRGSGVAEITGSGNTGLLSETGNNVCKAGPFQSDGTDGGNTQNNASGRVKVRANIGINFDEPLYTEPQDATGSSPATRSPIRHKNAVHRNPFLDDSFNDQNTNPGAYGFADTYTSSGKPPSLGADLLPGIPRVPSCGSAIFLAPQQPVTDMLAITPTTEKSLQTTLEPMRQRSGSDEIFDDSDGGDSEATEGCDECPDPDASYGREEDYGGPMLRSGSVCSDKSWSSSFSNENEVDELTMRCMSFMKEFVSKVFDNECSTTQADKATFGELCQHVPGRLWFARYVNGQRVNNKKVDEQILYRLVQSVAIALFECNEAEDFGPAKILMNMCFTFYYEVGEPPKKHFLYSFLRDQPVWHSLRFWNAAFFDALQYERARRPVYTNGDDPEHMMDDRHFQENITFGQLGTFTCNMRAFGLSRQLCLEFLRKQCTIADLREDQVRMIRDNVERCSDEFGQ